MLEDGKPQTIEQFRLIRVDGNPRPGDPPPRELRNRIDEEIEISRRRRAGVRVLLRRLSRAARQLDLGQGAADPVRPDAAPAERHRRHHVSAHAGRRHLVHAQPRVDRSARSSGSRGASSTTGRATCSRSSTRAQPDGDRRADPQPGRHGRAARRSRRGWAACARDARRSSTSAKGSPRCCRRRCARRRVDAGREQPGARRARRPARTTRAKRRRRSSRNRICTRRCATCSRRPTATTRRSTRSTRAGWRRSSSASTRTVGPNQDRRTLQMTQDTLRIARRGDRRPRDRQPQRPAARARADRPRLELLLPARLQLDQAPTDGKFHEIKVRLKRRGVDVRARKGYWALTARTSRVPTTPTVGNAASRSSRRSRRSPRPCRPASTCARGSAPRAASMARRASR